ncbi:MAG: hypothetical protein ACT4PP_15030 [Sporichthyaceae bacterium]
MGNAHLAGRDVMRASLTAMLAVALTMGMPVAGARAADAGTLRVSTGLDAREANDESQNPSISSDGRWVAFSSDASNLVAGDTNHLRDVFLHDTRTRRTTRISVSSEGRQGNAGSFNPSISDDGRFIAFDSFASNLVAGDRNRDGDVFVHDRIKASTTRVSLTPDGAEADGPSGFAVISGDGHVVAFESKATNLRVGGGPITDIYARDLRTTALDWVSRSVTGGSAAGGSGEISLSRDGNLIAFTSAASNLVLGDVNRVDDVFVRDRVTAVTARVSLTSLGGESNGPSREPALSDDGNVVSFSSEAENLTGLDPTNQAVPKFLLNPDGVLDVGDDNFVGDVFAHDRRTGKTELVSVSSMGTQGDSESYASAISGDGNLVVFVANSDLLVEGDANRLREVLIRDRAAATTTRVALSARGAGARGVSVQPAISADGSAIAYVSEAPDLVAKDRNRSSDVFIRR